MKQQDRLNQPLFASRQPYSSLHKHQFQKYYKNTKISQIGQSSEDQFQLNYHTLKKLQMPINKKRLSLGVWSFEENVLYLNFLKNNRECFQSQSSRRQHRILCKLSQCFGKKRTPDQCRCHHDKLFKKNKNAIDGIINQLQKKIQLKNMKALSSAQQLQINIQNPIKSANLSEKTKLPSPQINNFLDQNQPSIQQQVTSFYKLTVKNNSQIIIQLQQASIKSY